jgi:F-type H+-transporting ATPase subunit gamma
MANLKDIRDRIKSIKSIQQVTKAMKMVAAAKLRRAQMNMEQARPYSNRLDDMLSSLLPDVDRNMLPELQVREVQRKLFVVITSDRGMAGAFNSNILRKAHQEIDAFGKDNVDIICIGKKSRDYFKARSYKIISTHIDFWNTLNFQDAMSMGAEIIEKFTSGNVDEVRVVYNEFKSMGSQTLKDVVFLPLVSKPTEEKKSVDRLYEPSKEAIIQNIIPRHLNIQMWQYLLESNASEHAARMVAMENATENAGDMIKDLGLEYNKARQSAITTEIIEIVSGANALAG